MAYAELAVAVSDAGGLGIINALTQPNPEALRQEIRKTRTLTKHLFGVDLTLLPGPNPPEYAAFARTIIEGRHQNRGDSRQQPRPCVRRPKEAGIIIIHKTAKIRHAQAVFKLGVDILPITGIEYTVMSESPILRL